jgi:hypothetical protein
LLLAPLVDSTGVASAFALDPKKPRINPVITFSYPFCV